MRRVIATAIALAVSSASADDRPFHGSFSAGGTLLLSGADGDRQRGELVLDTEPWSRWGALVAWRGFDRHRGGLVMAGVAYEGGAARPRLVLDLHAEAGVDVDQHAPALGGGVRTLLLVIGPLGLATDAGAYLVIDGVDRTRLALTVGAAIAAAW
jgi:hypothetical protein